MSKKARDTQFQGFAKALITEIINEVPGTIYPWEIDISDKLEKLIARRAYDLAAHVINNSRANYMEDRSTKQLMPEIPDMPELPKEQE